MFDFHLIRLITYLPKSYLNRFFFLFLESTLVDISYNYFAPQKWLQQWCYYANDLLIFSSFSFYSYFSQSEVISMTAVGFSTVDGHQQFCPRLCESKTNRQGTGHTHTHTYKKKHKNSPGSISERLHCIFLNKSDGKRARGNKGERQKGQLRNWSSDLRSYTAGTIKKEPFVWMPDSRAKACGWCQRGTKRVFITRLTEVTAADAAFHRSGAKAPVTVSSRRCLDTSMTLEVAPPPP